MTININVKANKAILITSGSRLHGGFYHIGRNGWNINWGSLGFYIENPKFSAKAWFCDNEVFIDAPQFIKNIIESKIVPALKPQNICIKVKEHIPAHVGLGSTTQTALSIACAIELLNNRACDPVLLSKKLKLAKYSGAGTLLFKYGGFVIDSGLPDPEGPRELVHFNIPENWRFVILIPKLKRGLDEIEEERILERSWRPTSEAERLMSRGTLRILVGLRRGDLIEVINGLKDVQHGTGIYFSKIQGGVFREDLSNIVAEAEKNGIFLAQSSWGPTLYSITYEEMATSDVMFLKKILKNIGIEGDIILTKPRNKGWTSEFVNS